MTLHLIFSCVCISIHTRERSSSPKQHELAEEKVMQYFSTDKVETGLSIIIKKKKKKVETGLYPFSILAYTHRGFQTQEGSGRKLLELVHVEIINTSFESYFVNFFFHIILSSWINFCLVRK